MSNNNVKTYLEKLKAHGKHDGEFIDVLIASDVNGDDWSITATRLSEIIDRRYAESKKSKP